MVARRLNVSLISNALKKVAEQRSERKHPPVVPRAIAGHPPGSEKRRAVLLGLTILLLGVAIGVVVYSLIQYRSGRSTSGEAERPIPQQVIFEKISVPRVPSEGAVDEKPEPPQDRDVDQRTPLKPKVVQVAVPPKPESVVKQVKSASSEVHDTEAEKAITTGAIVPDGSLVESKNHPVQPGNKAKVGVISVPPTGQAAIDKKGDHAQEVRQVMARPVDQDEPEWISVLDSTKEPEPARLREERQERRVSSGKSGHVNLHSETTASVSSLYRGAVAHQKAERWQQAINAYTRVLKYEPMSAEVYNNIGVCYEKQGQLKIAAKYYEKAISINPRFYPSYNNLGIIYYKMQDFSKARAAYEQALHLNPGNSQSEINLALVYERLRRGELARRTLERVLINDPENAEAHYNLGRMLEDQGQPDKAITHYRKFLTSNSSAYPRLREKVKDRVATLEGPSSK
jgi:Tfp pilus assembly protein PilF